MKVSVITDDAVYGRMLCVELEAADCIAELLGTEQLPRGAVGTNSADDTNGTSGTGNASGTCSEKHIDSISGAAELVLADGDALTPEQLAALSARCGRLTVFARTVTDGERDGIAYLHRPMSMARLRVTVRRAAEGKAERLQFESASRILRLGNRECRLSPHEAQVFALLYKAQGHAVSRAEIDAALRGGIDSAPKEKIDTALQSGKTAERTNLCEVYITLLRRKLNATFGSPLVETVRGVGYMLPNDR